MRHRDAHRVRRAAASSPAAHHAPINGVLDDDTLASVLKVRSTGVEEWLLDCQAGYYIGAAQRVVDGIADAEGIVEEGSVAEGA